MSKTIDERIQELLEKGIPGDATLSSEEQKQVNAYHQLIALLKEENDLYVPAHFSAKIISTLQRKRDRTKHILIYTLTGILVGGGIAYFATIITSDIISILAGTFYRSRWICLFTIAIFLVIQFGGTKLVKSQKTMIRNS